MEIQCIALPSVTDALVDDAANHLVKTSPLLYSGVSEGMMTDTRILLEWARDIYQYWLNERTYRLGNVTVFNEEKLNW